MHPDRLEKHHFGGGKAVQQDRLAPGEEIDLPHTELKHVDLPVMEGVITFRQGVENSLLTADLDRGHVDEIPGSICQGNHRVEVKPIEQAHELTNGYGDQSGQAVTAYTLESSTIFSKGDSTSLRVDVSFVTN